VPRERVDGRMSSKLYKPKSHFNYTNEGKS